MTGQKKQLLFIYLVAVLEYITHEILERELYRSQAQELNMLLGAVLPLITGAGYDGESNTWCQEACRDLLFLRPHHTNMALPPP